MGLRGKKILQLLESRKLSDPNQEAVSSYVKTPTPGAIVVCKTQGYDVEPVEKLKDIIRQPSTSGTQRQSTKKEVSCSNIESQDVIEVEPGDKLKDMRQQPSTSGTQSHHITKKFMESSDEESITSGSEYCPSLHEDDSDQSELESETDQQKMRSSYNNFQNVMKAKRQVFFDNPTPQKNVIEDTIKNINNNQIESSKETENLQDDNMTKNKTTNENGISVHVTADGTKTNIKKGKTFELLPKISKKRMRNPETWKRKKAAILRQKGEEYVSQNGKVMKKKIIKEGVLCKENCRMNCNEKFSIEGREVILKKFYGLDVNAKNTLIFKSIKILPVSRHRSARKSSKKYSFKYSVTYDKQLIQVCRDAFCCLYGIGRKKVEITQNLLKLGYPAPSPDKRGHHTNRPRKIDDDVVKNIVSHINQFPAEESHYSRNKNHSRKYLSPLLNITRLYQLYIEQCKEKKLDDKFMVKVSFYRQIFETKFNLSFGHPKSDTCSICDAGEKSLEHKENFEFAFNTQKLDRTIPAVDKKICYITMDLQQTMPLPKLSTSKAFYLRQMWLYNFGIHCITYSGHKSCFFTWTEDWANRGSNEIGSCLLRFCKLLKEEEPEIEHLIIWSDSCAGQNKNFFILCLYQYLILKKIFKVIDHKFPEVGHSYLDSDRDFGRIEKVLRKHQTILIPDQYREIIKSASTKNSLCFNMKNFFYNLEELPAKLRLYKKLSNTLNEKVNLRDSVKWIRVDHFGFYYYKANLDPFTPFLQVDLHKKGANDVLSEQVFLSKLSKCGGLTVEKMNNLREQLKFIDEDYRWFYEEILNENIENPKKKRKTC